MFCGILEQKTWDLTNHFSCQTAWVQILGLPFISCTTWNRLLNIIQDQVSHLWTRGDNFSSHKEDFRIKWDRLYINHIKHWIHAQDADAWPSGTTSHWALRMSKMSLASGITVSHFAPSSGVISTRGCNSPSLSWQQVSPFCLSASIFPSSALCASPQEANKLVHWPVDEGGSPDGNCSDLGIFKLVRSEVGCHGAWGRGLKASRFQI